MRRVERDKKDGGSTRERLLDAGFREFSEHGVAGARVDRIADLAGCNKESLYRYFGSKREFLHRVLDRYLDERGEDLVPDPDSLETYAAKTLAFTEAQPEHLRLMVWEGMEAADMDETATARRADHYRAKVERVRALQERGEVDPTLDPALLLIALLGMGQYWSVVPQVVRLFLGHEPSPEDRRRYADLVTELSRRLLHPLRENA